MMMHGLANYIYIYIYKCTFNLKCSGLKMDEIRSAWTNMATESKMKPG